MGAFFTLADHNCETDALLALTLSQDPFPGQNIPLGMEYLALTDPISTAIGQQDEGIQDFWHAVLPVLFWLCSENSEWGKQGKPVRPAPIRVGKHQRLIPPDKPVQILQAPGPVLRSGRHRDPRKQIPPGEVPVNPIDVFALMSEKPTGKAT